ncbi:hypothetical protein B0H14DRAFT_2614847 [Mycena olivaceomarginata]|nr:hypothetical protein B0H14DRAFT_2614847 [Mycena olivaceomarginata]
MPPQKTIAAVSQPRQRNVAPKPRAPLTQEERQAILDYVFDQANKLAEKYDKKSRYFLDCIFQGGSHMVNHQHEVNTYNAFKSEKAAELRAAGTPMNAGQIHNMFHHEYLELTDAEKVELADRHKKERDAPVIRRDTPRALVWPRLRVGVEGFFVVVRSNTDFNCEPYWFFTSNELKRYLPLAIRKRWDTAEVGVKLEAFALASCDTINLLRTAPQKAAHAKAEIRDGMDEKLVAITGDPNARMAYVNYEEDVVFKYGVEFIGWTPDKWCNPSNLTSSLPVLRTLVNAIKNDQAKFVRLTPKQLKARREKYDEDIAAGRITGKQRNPRSDRDKKCKRAFGNKGDEGDEELPAMSANEDEELPGRPEQRPTPPGAAGSGTLIPSSVEEPDDAPPATKRRKTTLPKSKRPARKLANGQAPKAKSREPPRQRQFPGSSAGRAFKSRAIVMSDDESPEAVDAAPTAAVDGVPADGVPTA